MMNKLSLFVIGMPRSGTKLFRELLNNHDEIFIPEIETLFIPSLLRRYDKKNLNNDEIEQIMNNIKSSLFSFYYLPKYGFDFSNLKINNVSAKEFIDHFFNELAKQRGKTVSILGDKSPNYIEDIDILKDNYPNAKFIHIVRDPRDYVLSMNKAWGKNMYRAAYRWKKSVNKLSEMDFSKRENIIEIKYEDLIQDPDTTLRNVCDFLEIEYVDNLTKLDKGVENLGDAKSATIESNNTNKFLSKLNDRQIQKIEKLTYPAIGKYYEGLFEINRELVPSKFQLTYWKLLDGLNLIKYNLKTHGFGLGLEKILKAKKARS